MTNPQSLADSLKNQFGSALQSCAVDLGEVTIEVKPAALIEVCQKLVSAAEFSFEMLIDLCGVDYSTYGHDEWATDDASNTGFCRAVDDGTVADINNKPGRYAVVYHLLSITNNHRLRVRCRPENNDFPKISSVIELWSCANWYEREAFDLFGILFEGHPDLRRLLTDYGFIGHPFRKDFPLTGQVEMRYDPEQKRVIYEPVSIEPRVLVPRVIRHDHRFVTPESSQDNKDGETDA